MKNFISALAHYEALIDEGNDPVEDPAPLRAYMDKWDGEVFLELLGLTGDQAVLEIGVGTGRLAVRVIPHCGSFIGIDISPKTLERARLHLADHGNASLLCGDFMTAEIPGEFDVIYSSLTFMHLPDKAAAVAKASSLLVSGGRFVLSIDKNPSDVIDLGERSVAVHPDTPEEILRCLREAGLELTARTETEFAHIFAAVKP